MEAGIWEAGTEAGKEGKEEETPHAGVFAHHLSSYIIVSTFSLLYAGVHRLIFDRVKNATVFRKLKDFNQMTIGSKFH